jgi:lysophospholipase L1-like esterase
MGCIGHPNSKGQQALADVIYPEVKQMLSAKYGAYNE